MDQTKSGKDQRK